jgi:hypothetical protein
LDIKDLKKAVDYLTKNASAGPLVESNSGSGINSSDLEDLLKRLKDLESKMDSKLDRVDFKNEVADLRSMIGNLEQDDKKEIKVTKAPTS